MKEIECPACGEMIPDDSKYCDMCGVELLECINCGALGTDEFCGECGKPMVSRGTVTKNETSQQPSVSVPEPVVDVNTTVGGRRAGLALKARKGNFILRPEDEAVIGRSDSPYAQFLGDHNLISRRHGKFIKRGRDWYIVDFGSTNGTYLNDVELMPNEPTKLAVGDVVDIGTYLFDVVER